MKCAKVREASAALVKGCGNICTIHCGTSHLEIDGTSAEEWTQTISPKKQKN